MPYSTRFAKLRAMLLRLLPQILLLLALLFAQVGGLTHGVSHTRAAPHNEQSQPITDAHCDLCDEYAQIGSPLHSQLLAPLAPLRFTDSRARPAWQPLSAPFTAFAARAPPAADFIALR